MGQILVRKLDDEVVAALKRKAENQDKSLEQYVREVLAREAQPSREQLFRIAEEIRATTRRPSRAPEDIIREDRDTDHGRPFP